MNLGVMIVTYKRPGLLRNCLGSLARQTAPPYEVIVAGVEGDSESERVVQECASLAPYPCRWLPIAQPSIVLQTDAGVEGCISDIVVFTNDDAEAYPDWLERIEPYYADPSVGGVGGRDFIHRPDGSIIDGTATVVGKLTWFGRLHGNHHLSYDRVASVDLLKGVNMSCRRELYAPLDPRMVPGGRWHWEIDLCLGILNRGERLVFDPAICVDHFHYQAARPGTDAPGFVYAANHNLTLNLCKHYGRPRRLAFLLYTFLWGDYPEMGLAVFLRTYLGLALRGQARGFGQLLEVSLRGKVDALRALWNGGWRPWRR